MTADYFAQHMHNCDLVNLYGTLERHGDLRERMIEKPHCFSTACNIATQIIAQVASNQYGGQSNLPDPSGSLRADFPREDYQSGGRAGNGQETWNCQPSTEQVSSMVVERRLRRKRSNRGVQTIQYQVSNPVDHQRSGALRDGVHVSERGAERAGEEGSCADY